MVENRKEHESHPKGAGIHRTNTACRGSQKMNRKKVMPICWELERAPLGSPAQEGRTQEQPEDAGLSLGRQKQPGSGIGGGTELGS